MIMAMLALFFGVQAGNMAAVAAAGYAKNLRHDIFYKVQDFSFKNIDHFSTSGLVDPNDYRYHQCPDGVYDEHPSFGKSTDYGRFCSWIMTASHKCQDSTSFC